MEERTLTLAFSWVMVPMLLYHSWVQGAAKRMPKLSSTGSLSNNLNACTRQSQAKELVLNESLHGLNQVPTARDAFHLR